jgi:hypothetical protein
MEEEKGEHIVPPTSLKKSQKRKKEKRKEKKTRKEVRNVGICLNLFFSCLEGGKESELKEKKKKERKERRRRE